MSSANRSIKSKTLSRLRFRLGVYSALHQLAASCSAALVMMGVWVIFCRWVRPEWLEFNEKLALALALATGISTVILTLRARESTAIMAAFADRHADAGGLLLTLNDHPDPRWEPLLEERMTASPPPRMDLDRPARQLLPSLAFFGLCLLFPSQQSDWSTAVQDIGRHSLDRVESRINAFEAAQILDAEELSSFRKTLESLRKSVEKREFGGAEWEAADGISKRLTDKLDRTLGAAEAGLDAARALSQSTDTSVGQETLTEAIRQMDQNGLLRGLPEEVKGRLLQEAVSALRDNIDLPELTPERVAALRQQMLRALEGR